MTDTDMTAPMPPTLNNLVPYITVDGTQKAAEFYKAAFGAVVAFAVPAPGRSVTEQELLQFCRRRLPEGMAPARVVFLERLPRSSFGKLLRRNLPL